MSVIERYSPLNLFFKVIIVTNASSPLGVVVCKTLLKSNALVLGTDSKPKDETLNDGVYSHFQFHQCKLTDPSSAKDLQAYAQKMFKSDRLYALVNLASADDDQKMQDAHEKLAITCAETMKAQGGGSIVNSVLQAADGGDMTEVAERLVTATKNIASNTGNSVRCNMITPSAKKDAKPSEKFNEARSHMDFLFTTKSTAQNLANKDFSASHLTNLFDFSNVTLFLSSEMSEGVNGNVFTAAGTAVAA